MIEKFSVHGVTLGLGFPLIIDILFLRLLKWLMIVGVVYQKSYIQENPQAMAREAATTIHPHSQM